MKKKVLIFVILTTVLLVTASYFTIADPNGNNDGTDPGDDNSQNNGQQVENPAPFDNVNLTQITKFKIDLLSGSEKEPAGRWWRISGGALRMDEIDDPTVNDTENKTIIPKNGTKVYKLEPMKEKPNENGKKKFLHIWFLNEFDEPLAEIDVFPPRHDIFNLDKDLEDNETRDVIFKFNNEQQCTWGFFRAFPIKWEGPALNANSSAVAIESIAMACEWVELDIE